MLVIPVFINNRTPAPALSLTPQEVKSRQDVNAYMSRCANTPRDQAESALKRLGKIYGLGGKE